MTRRAAAIAGAAVAIALAAVAILGGDGENPSEQAARIAGAAASAGTGSSGEDPLAWDPARRDELERRAATGTSHVIYAKSPEGVIASAERTAAWRGLVERAAARHEVDPDRLEAIVFLESAGRPEVIAGDTPEVASGLVQIISSTATDLLGMRVDLAESIRLTRAIARAQERGREARASKLIDRRAKIDQRFEPRLALEGAARYLEIAAERFGATDLASVSYHMGIGNLESVIRAYADVGAEQPIGEVVADGELSWAQLYFDTAPDHEDDAYGIIAGLSDDSAEYYWRLLASERIMELWREDRAQLEHAAELATAKATLEELYHPEERTLTFDEPDDIERAMLTGQLLPLPDSGELGWAIHGRMGEQTGTLDREPELYRALRPEALATLSYMASGVRELSGADRPLRVTSSVRDGSYQDLLVGSNPEATAAYSLHTTGYAFDVLRRYESDAQAASFQFMLDRLQALAVIDYAVEPSAIHITVSPLGAELVED